MVKVIPRAARAAALAAIFVVSTACGSGVYAQSGRNYPRNPTYPGTGSGYPGQRGGARVYQDPAFMQGYDDGYQRGYDDARDRDRYDVRGDSRYRRADRGYDRRYGSRTAWSRNYRGGFTQGYDLGYRDGQYNSRNNRNNRNNRGVWRP